MELSAAFRTVNRSRGRYEAAARTVGRLEFSDLSFTWATSFHSLSLLTANHIFSQKQSGSVVVVPLLMMMGLDSIEV